MKFELFRTLRRQLSRRNGMVEVALRRSLFGVAGLDKGALTGLAMVYVMAANSATAGRVVAWGANGTGQCNVPAGLNAASVSGGGYHSLALRADGTVVGWGHDFYSAASVPIGLSNVVGVAAGGYHSLALKSNGQVVGWGYNGDGAAAVPEGLTAVTAIAAGYYHSLALRSDGTVVAWGANTYGGASVPVGLSQVTAVAAGAYHSLALKGDGTVVAWGQNTYGQTNIPIGLRGVKAVAAGAYHSVALLSDGSLIAWGFNGHGALDVPPGTDQVVAIAANYHTLALRAEGSVQGWGYNQYGEASTPPGLTNVVGVSAGYFHTLALAVDAPVANAGADRHVNEGVSVILDASGSYDPNRPALPLRDPVWSQIAGPSVSLSNANTFFPTFVAPRVPASGAVLTFVLFVSNGVSTGSSTVSILVDNLNSVPDADAGTLQTVDENTLVTLKGSGNDADGDLLTLTWTQIAGSPVVLDGADTATPTFIAPAVNAAQGSLELIFRLTVNDGLVSSGPSDVTIHVRNTNDPPVARAGADVSLNEAEAVSLDGSESYDPNNDVLSYQWTQIGGSPIVDLSGAHLPIATFKAPDVAIGGATLTFELTVSDGEMRSAAIVNVRINNVNHRPIADAGIDQAVPEHAVVTLDASGSGDPDGDALVYSWEQTRGTPVELTNDNSPAPHFTAPDVGTGGSSLTFRLHVDDGHGGVTTDDVNVNVRYVNRLPAVDAGADQVASEGSVVVLSGEGTDPDGNALAFSWVQVSGPSIQTSNAADTNFAFTAPAVSRDGADVIVRLTASDSYGGSATDDVTIRIANVNHAPTVQAPANLSVPEEKEVNLVGYGSDQDAEERSELRYRWQQIVGPPVVLMGEGATVSFIAPTVNGRGDPDAKVTLTFQLTVEDPNQATGSDQIEVVVTNNANSPIASAGGNLTVNEGTAVTLNGSASNDPDGDALSYSWVQTGGPTVVLNDADTAYPYFQAPFVQAGDSTLTFMLTVFDGFDRSSTDTATVTIVNINDPPGVIHARPNLAVLWPPDHRMVPISILGIVDPNGNAEITITGVAQDEPTGGPRKDKKHGNSQRNGRDNEDDDDDDTDDSDNEVDAIITSDGTLLLRAERHGKGDGRVYCISFTASDFEGAHSGKVKVMVPHSKKRKNAQDSGCKYNSLVPTGIQPRPTLVQ